MSMTDLTGRRLESFLNHLKEKSREIAPDYPWSGREDAWEWLYAITSSYEGVMLANADLHELTAETARLRKACRLLLEGTDDVWEADHADEVNAIKQFLLESERIYGERQ